MTTLPRVPDPADQLVSAGYVVAARLVEQVTALHAQDPRVREQQPDAVHQMRVATRRLRAALSTFGSLLDQEVSGSLREELQWLAGVLGAARDAEVVRERLRVALADQPARLVRGPVAARIDSALELVQRRGHSRAVAAMSGSRYDALLARLDDLTGAPPWAPAATTPASETLPRLVGSDWARLARRVHRATLAEDAEDHVRALHDARRAAKRLRYAAETVAPTFGTSARRLAGAVTAGQTALGEHHDSVVAVEALLGLADQAAAQAEDTFTYGWLIGREQAASRVAEARFEEAWHAATLPELREWLVERRA
jgi:CHAD domain-containing protein